MAMQGWKRWALVGLLGVAGLSVGCRDRREPEIREEAREVGQGLKEAGRDVRDSVNNAGEGLREGIGGSGQREDGVDIGRNPGVINDGEGPLENGRGPLEEGDLQPGNSPDVVDEGEGNDADER
jgi:hypothetical protein